MKATPFPPFPALPYSLHDCRITGADAAGDTLTLRFAEGFVRTGAPCAQVAGELRFERVDWDFCFAYTLEDCRNEGRICGEKRFLADFLPLLAQHPFEVVDETYGYRMAKFCGEQVWGETRGESAIELSFGGPMTYRTEEP